MRFCMGAGGAAFVVTQYWTTTMFANNIVGTANATTAGWGNLGGGVTQMLIANPDLGRGVDDALSYNDNSYVSRQRAAASGGKKLGNLDRGAASRAPALGNPAWASGL